MKILSALFCLFGLVASYSHAAEISFNAALLISDEVDDLQQVSNSLKMSARQLDRATQDYQEGDELSILENKLTRLKRLVADYSEALEVLDSGSSGGFAACVSKLIDEGFSRTRSADYCHAAGRNAVVFADCVASLIEHGYSRTLSADSCKIAGPQGPEYSRCIGAMNELGYSRTQSSDRCLAAGEYAQIFTECVSKLQDFGYSRTASADYCHERERSGNEFATCVGQMIDLGYSRTQAVQSCQEN